MEDVGQQEGKALAEPSFSRLVSEVGWPRIVLTTALYLVVIVAGLVAVPPSATMVMLICLFGGEVGSGWKVVSYLCIPAGEMFFTALGAWWALWLWNSSRGNFVSFPIAFALLTTSTGLFRWMFYRH
jgi:hypothetical protein